MACGQSRSTVHIHHHPPPHLTRQNLRAQVAFQFAPELSALPARERELAMAALDTMLQFESLDFLVRHEGLDRAAVAQVLARHLRVHLAA